MTFAPVDLPSSGPDLRTDRLGAEIHGWIASPPMRALVAAFGGELPGGTVGDRLAWLDDFSARHWDFRARAHGVERDRVQAITFEPDIAELILSAATALRLVEPTRPPHPVYDHLLVLGGLGPACLQRTEYAARLVRDLGVTVAEVAALGSFRPLTADETDLAPLAGCRFEVDAMDVGVRSAFGLTGPAERDGSDDGATHRSWEVRTYRPAGGPELHVLAAPSSDPDRRRANTPDSYEFWARRVKLGAADRILVVTSPIYVPFQHSDALRILGLRHGCAIDTVGFDPERATVPLAEGATNPDRYLQELRSGIRSMRHLREAAAEVTGQGPDGADPPPRV